MCKKYLIISLGFFLGASWLIVLKNVEAAQWDYALGLEAGVQYTDNFYFLLTDKTSETNLLLVPGINVRGESDRTLTTLDVGVRLERYDEIKEADRDDPYVYFNWERYWERHTLGVGLSYWQERTRTSELESSGITNIFGTRTNSSANPSWLYTVNENNNIELSMELLDVAYDIPTLIDYQNYMARLRWDHEIGPRNTIYLVTSANTYNAEAIGLDYNYGEVLAGMLFLQNEQFEYELSLGVGYADRELEEDYTTWVANARFRSEREYDETSLTLSTELVPTGAAELRMVHALDLLSQREMTLDIEFTFYTRFSRSEPVRELFSVINENLVVRPGLTYQLTETWFLESWYQYRSNRDIGGDTVKENSIYLGFRYDFGLLEETE